MIETTAAAIQQQQQQPASNSSSSNNSNPKKKKKAKTTSTTSSKNNNDTTAEKVHDDSKKQQEQVLLVEDHLPPLGLVFTVILCSGFLMTLALRDVLATGKIILGLVDEPLQEFTKNNFFYNDEHGWKSQQGGLSTILQYSTDHNNMGGLFIRKMGGVVHLGVHLQKLFPLLFHPIISLSGIGKVPAQWKQSHFAPMFQMALLGNIAIIMFYISYLEDLYANDVTFYPKIVIAILSIESLVILFYLSKNRKQKKRTTTTTTTTDKKTDETKTTTTTAATTNTTKQQISYKFPEGKTPKSVINRIVTRTVCIVSSLMALLALRDLFLPELILAKVIPRDDIYLEWTNSLLHSPPPSSPEYHEAGLEAPLYIGDKFVSQLYALGILILVSYKFLSAVAIRQGKDGISGSISAIMIWRVQALVNGGMLFILRLFTPAAATASLDLRWHLMFLAYETFILGLYGFF